MVARRGRRLRSRRTETEPARHQASERVARVTEIAELHDLRTESERLLAEFTPERADNIREQIAKRYPGDPFEKLSTGRDLVDKLAQTLAVKGAA